MPVEMGCAAGLGEKVPSLGWETMDHQDVEGERKGETAIPCRTEPLPLSLWGVELCTRRGTGTDLCLVAGKSTKSCAGDASAAGCGRRRRNGQVEVSVRPWATGAGERSRVSMDWSKVRCLNLSGAGRPFLASEVRKRNGSLELPTWLVWWARVCASTLFRCVLAASGVGAFTLFGMEWPLPQRVPCTDQILWDGHCP